MSKRPGGELAARPLHFIWICDCSGSMSVEGKIETLNQAIREAIPHMRDVADENPNAEIQVRVLTFSDGAQWHVSNAEPIASFKWTDLRADGVTDMGRALTMLADQLKIPPMTDRALPPVLVLISDGQPTDDFDTGDRKSTRLNSSHTVISYAVFCLKKKNNYTSVPERVQSHTLMIHILLN